MDGPDGPHRPGGPDSFHSDDDGPHRPGPKHHKPRPIVIPDVITPSTIPGCAGAVAEKCCYDGKNRDNCLVDGVEFYFPNDYATNDNLFWVDPKSGDICACP